jgi:hypothetical protein
MPKHTNRNPAHDKGHNFSDKAHIFSYNGYIFSYKGHNSPPKPQQFHNVKPIFQRESHRRKQRPKAFT